VTKSEEKNIGACKFEPVVSQRALSFYKKNKQADDIRDKDCKENIQKTEDGTTISENKHASNTKDALAKAPKSKSECSVKDHEVVFVKSSVSSEIPACQRLWRFAIKNRKKQESQTPQPEGPSKPIVVPNARSNEAIFEGLKQRLANAKMEENVTQERSQQTDKKKLKALKPRKTRRKSVQEKCKRSKTFQPKPSPLVKGAVSDQTVGKSAPSTEVKRQSSLPNTTIVSTYDCHDASQEQIKKLIASSESLDLGRVCTEMPVFKTETYEAKRTKNTDVGQVHTGTPALMAETYEAKRTKYDNLLRRRLNCGSQLETLNKEIVNNVRFSLKSF